MCPCCPKVRSLWSDIDGMLSTIKEEQSAVHSVLKGDVDQYILDGTDQVLRIPRCLLERIEQLPHRVRQKRNVSAPPSLTLCVYLFFLMYGFYFQLSSGNVYEANQLNLLFVMELMTHTLQLLKVERSRVSHVPKPQLSPHHLREKCRQMGRTLQDLHLIRYTSSCSHVSLL